MDEREGHLIIAVSLTVSGGFVTVYYGWPMWRALSGRRWKRGLLFTTVATRAKLPANLVAQAIPLSAKRWGGRDV